MLIKCCLWSIDVNVNAKNVKCKIEKFGFQRIDT